LPVQRTTIAGWASSGACNSEALRAVVANNAGTPHASSELQEILVSEHFNKDMTVQEAFKTHAGARRVFAKFHLGGCSNCAISESETIEQVSEGYGIPLPMLMEELDKLFATGGLNVGDKVRLPDEIRSKIPQLATVPEIGEVKSVENGAYTVEFGEVRLQGLGDDFIKVETAGATA
jgi:hybrid cluster-associated redox disulfide protein